PEVITDIMGQTGTDIIKAIVAGERDAKRLAKVRHVNCKADEAAIAAALKGAGLPEYVFELGEDWKLYQEYRRRIGSCDQKIEACLRKFKDVSEGRPLAKRRVARGKNDVSYDLRSLLLRLAGVDVTVLEGIQESTALVLLSEIGPDLSAFAT